MPRLNSILLQCLTYGLLIGLTYALDGKMVRALRPTPKFRYVVSISNRSTTNKFEHRHFCTGTIVHPTRIVTAAHCLVNRTPSEIVIIAGSDFLNSGKKYYPESWITFNQWNPHHGNRPLHKNDIAIIKLQGEGITIIKPVELFVKETLHVDNRTFVITGWGETFKGTKVVNLRRGSVNYVTNEECSERGTALKGEEFVVPPNYFCTKSHPYVLLTRGDGGAPIFNREDKLIGISVGTCPKIEGYLFNDEEYIRENKMNAHLRISYYSDFVLHA